MITLDKNGIWSKSGVNTVHYPEVGNADSFNAENSSFWFQHRNRVIATVINRFQFKDNYADVGGGNGFQAAFIAKQFPGREIFLIEPGYTGCLNAKKRGLKNVYNIFFEDFPFKEHNVNGVGMYDVIEHIEDDVNFLRNLSGCCPGGTFFYIAVPAYEWLWSEADDYGEHFRRYNLKSIEALGRNAGLQVIYSTCFFSYLVPLTFFVRSLPYKIFGKHGNGQVVQKESKLHDPGKLISATFDFAELHEIKRLSTGKIPIGASCFAVFKN